MENNFDFDKEKIKNILAAPNNNSVNDSELDKAEEAIINYAQSHAVNPPENLRNKIFAKINKLTAEKRTTKNIDLNSLPVLDQDSNWMDWQEATAHIEPPAYDDIYLHTLESNEHRELFVAWVKDFVPDEVHHDLLESFLILEGSCECYIKTKRAKSAK
ncbi:MAG: hypothetical protein IPP29_24785 [Bacteroidetes bacterium]|nr:hypothetical protein [Bacteroidota bacterium]